MQPVLVRHYESTCKEYFDWFSEKLPSTQNYFEKNYNKLPFDLASPFGKLQKIPVPYI